MLNQFLSNANWLAIIVAAIAYFALGAVWYSALFQKQWMALNNIPAPTPEKQEQMKGMMLPMFTKSFLMGLVVALVLGVLVGALGIHGVVPGIKLGLLLSVAGCVPMLMSHLYMMKPFQLWVIDSGYHIVGFALMALIISAWR